MQQFDRTLVDEKDVSVLVAHDLRDVVFMECDEWCNVVGVSSLIKELRCS